MSELVPNQNQNSAKREPRIDQKSDPKVLAQKRWDAQKERDLEMVYGIFENKEKKGQIFEFMYSKYADEPYTKYTLKDGQRTRLPRHVAKHLNQNCYYIDYKLLTPDLKLASQAKHERDEPKMYAEHKIPRVAFNPLDYMDDDLEPQKEVINVVYR